jgi:hypothetical protein
MKSKFTHKSSNNVRDISSHIKKYKKKFFSFELLQSSSLEKYRKRFLYNQSYTSNTSSAAAVCGAIRLMSSFWNNDQKVKPGTPSIFYSYFYQRFLFNEVENESFGGPLEAAAYAAKYIGICSENKWPSTDTTKITEYPGPLTGASAYNHRIDNYYMIPNDVDLLDTIKLCITLGFPVCIAIVIDDKFFDLGENGIVTIPTSSKGEVWAMYITEYDDANNGYFTCVNSIGNYWGDAGVCYIPYKYLTTKITIPAVQGTATSPVIPSYSDPLLIEAMVMFPLIGV